MDPGGFSVPPTKNSLEVRVRKVNNVWGDLLQAEAMEEVIKQMDSTDIVVEDAMKVERGPESFTIPIKRKRSPSSESTRATHTREIIESKSESYNQSLLAARSARFGSSEQAETFKFLDPKVEAFVESSAELSKLKKSIELLDDAGLGIILANTLEEPKVRILNNSILHLGRNRTVELFFKTLFVENSGGMMVEDNTRRRTPGGVFFRLLRTEELPKEAVKAIMDADREKNKIEWQQRNRLKAVRRSRARNIYATASRSPRQDANSQFEKSIENGQNSSQENMELRPLAPNNNSMGVCSEDFLEIHADTDMFICP